MRSRNLSLLLILALTATASVAMAQISVESIERQVYAEVRDAENPVVADIDLQQSFEMGPLNLIASASLVGHATSFQATDLLVETTELTYAGVYRVHLWQDTPDVSEIFGGRFLTFLIFSLPSEGMYDLALTPAGDDATVAYVLLLCIDEGVVMDTYVDSPQSFSGTLQPDRRYLLQVQGNFSQLMSAPFDWTVGLDIEFIVTQSDPVATEPMRLSEVKALFD